MAMDELARLEGADLDSFLDLCQWMVDNREAVYRVRACVDEGTLKLKVGERTWTPPMGRMDPECQEAQRRAEPINSGNWNSRVRAF